MEVGLKHIYSDRVHIGILEGITPNFIKLKQENKVLSLKLSNVEVLSDVELKKWKINNYPQRSFHVSALFPDNCNPDLIVGTIKILDGVIDTSLLEVYNGNQVEPGKISITIEYLVIDLEAMFRVERLLKGFGAIIR